MIGFNPQHLIQQILHTKLSMCVSGVGTNLLSYMTKYPGASRFFLQGHNLYSRESVLKFLGLSHSHTTQNPHHIKFCSLETAQLQASRCFLSAQHLMFDSIDRDYRKLNEVKFNEVLGVALNGSLSSNYQKKGKIQCFLAMRWYDYMRSYHLLLDKPLGRIEQEELFSNTCLDLMVRFVKTRHSPQELLAPYENCSPNLTITSYESHIPLHSHNSILLPSMLLEPPLENIAMLSGSFNPFHIGHHQMVNIASSHPLVNHRPVILELTLKNADKPANTEIQERVRSIVKEMAAENQNLHKNSIQALKDIDLNVLLSHNGRFIDKGLKNGVFIVGADTYIRLGDLQFYNNSPKQLQKAIAKFTVDEVSFLVFHRNSKDHQPIKIADLGLHYDVVDSWQNDISSTQIREHSK